MATFHSYSDGSPVKANIEDKALILRHGNAHSYFDADTLLGFVQWLSEQGQLPCWRDRPTEPGTWYALPDESGRARATCQHYTQEDLDRGAPFYTSRVYGPIPSFPSQVSEQYIVFGSTKQTPAEETASSRLRGKTLDLDFIIGADHVAKQQRIEDLCELATKFLSMTDAGYQT